MLLLWFSCFNRLGIAALTLCCSAILYLYPLTFQNHKNFSFLSLMWQVIREYSLLKEQQIHRYCPMKLSFSRFLTSVCLIFNWALRKYFGRWVSQIGSTIQLHCSTLESLLLPFLVTPKHSAHTNIALVHITEHFHILIRQQLILVSCTLT